MTQGDWFMFISTFLVGACAGAYLYAMSFKPVYQPNDIDWGEISASDFSITGRSYGGTNAGYVHPTFRVVGDGSYAFLPGGVGADASNTPEEGDLPRAIFGDLRSAVLNANLPLLAAERPQQQCDVHTGGIDYAYRVIIEGTQYELDTCATALSRDADLTNALENVWAYLQDGDTPAEVGGDEDDQGFLESWLGSQFERDGEREEEPVACTMEAKICPDGSAVGRTGPNCEFAACPRE